MEWLVSVDLVLASWSIVVDALVVPVVNRALDAESTMFTIAVIVAIVWGGAWMSSGLPSILVGLHDVELWAVLASIVSANALGITVVEAVSQSVASA